MMESICVRCKHPCKENENKRSRMVYCGYAPEGKRIYNHGYDVAVRTDTVEKVVAPKKRHKPRLLKKGEVYDEELD